MVLMGQISIMIILGICASALQATSLLDQHGRSSSDETGVCKEACHRTFTAGSLSGKSSLDLEDSCLRGCRFYSIVEVLDKKADYFNTLQCCYDNCHDAYLGQYNDNEACRSGCDHQKPYKMKATGLDPKIKRPKGRENVFSVLHPILQIHNLYKSMRQASWSFFTLHDKEGNAGDLVIIQTKPWDESFNNHLLSKQNGLLADDTQTLKHSQLKAISNPSHINKAFDWLTSLPQNTGIPGTFVFILLLLPAMALVWMCMSAADTAPDQHMKKSLKSEDLDSTATLPEKKDTSSMCPQAAVDSTPLPSKMTVNQL